MKIVILYNPSKSTAIERAEDLGRCLASLDIQVELFQTEREKDKWVNIDFRADMVVVFGGDGTFLSSARRVYETDTPILGINHGHLGFLSDQGDISMHDLAEDIKSQNFYIEERTMLQAFLPDYKRSFIALNEIAINRTLHSNLLYTDLYVDNVLVHSFRADGLIVCTPTGSTAYALSAGGAVMDPNIRAFQIVPIAAHSLSSRPHVISDEQTIVLLSRDKLGFYMQADGQELISLLPGTRVEIKKSSRLLKLVKLRRGEQNFYSILRDKMKWGLTNS